MTRCDLSIIVVSYNTRELTLKCLASVVEQTRTSNYELIVVDNQSSDGSAEAIASQFKDVRLIRPETNLGFANANNLAAKEARGEYLLLLNPDTVVLDEAIDRLMNFARQQPTPGIWGGRTLYPDKTLNPYSCWAKATPWSAFCRAVGLSSLFKQSETFNPEAYGGWRRDTVREVDIVTGCLLLIRKQEWDRLGGFDPAFFMYGEEADLCLRARQLDIQPMMTPEATIIHYGGASENVQSDKMVRLLKAKAMLFRRHCKPLAAFLGVRMLDLWALTRLTAFTGLQLLKPRWREAKATWLSIWQRRSEWHEAKIGPAPDVDTLAEQPSPAANGEQVADLQR